jgi:SET domain-containing protein
MFNHSCAPNIGWEHEGNNSTLKLFAEREIVEGEELFISYIKPLGMGWAERQQALMPWLGMDCECERCQEERPKDGAN